MSDAPTPPESSNPLWWTAGLVVFTLIVWWWFGYWMRQGELAARQHPKPVIIAVAGEPDHAALIQDNSEAVVKAGRAVYNGKCTTCHGGDGGVGTLASARVFKRDAMQNGADPYGLYLTLVNGYNAMPAQTTLSPEDKYAVIHYIRETFFREDNPGQYTAVDDAYLSTAAWPPPSAGGEAEGPTIPRHELPLEVPVYAVMADLSATTADAESAFRALTAAVSGEVVVDVERLVDALRRGLDPRTPRLLALLDSGDREGFRSFLLAPGAGDLQAVFATLPAARIDRLFDALRQGRSAILAGHHAS